MIARTKSWLILLALFSSAAMACRTLPVADPESLTLASDNSTKRIETLIHAWFTWIEDPTASSSALDELLSEASFELSLVDEMLSTRDELRAWASNLRATFPHLEYQLGSIRIEPAGPNLYRAQFEFDRRATDGAGLPHVARREHSWLIQHTPNETLALLKIEERPLVFFPGTGPKIVCY